MRADTAREARTAAIPVISSGAEAIRVAGQFAASIAEGVIDRDRSGAVSARELTALDASGLLGITVPRAYGGADMPAPVLAEVVRVIAAVDPAIAQVQQSHFLLVDLLAILGTPVPAFLAVSSLLLVAAACLWLGARQVRTLEINYGTE